MAEANVDQNFDENMSPELALEMESLKTTDRAALLMLLLESFKLVYANSLRVHDTQGYIRLGICQWKSF